MTDKELRLSLSCIFNNIYSLQQTWSYVATMCYTLLKRHNCDVFALIGAHWKGLCFISTMTSSLRIFTIWSDYNNRCVLQLINKIRWRQTRPIHYKGVIYHQDKGQLYSVFITWHCALLLSSVLWTEIRPHSCPSAMQEYAHSRNVLCSAIKPPTSQIFSHSNVRTY